ncbi:hypothetical protein MTsPCn5_06170 [Croceitalea sp. MTPC5]|uniref:3D domain-containing protein n=1 Tax=Croceitalea sp. MTPC5 TaxID=3056565 RepID=UPI002B3DD0AA|nr:hypothetical protein MTsPCn5_06170 [Croceitalea sp. MTPC5]
MRRYVHYLVVLCLLGLGCHPERQQFDKHDWYGLEVTASAYNSLSYQTDNTPSITAWGDTLKPGMKCIAISRDLLALGFHHNMMVRIDTFSDTFYVKDKMHQRWKNRIDIYMGKDVQKARDWGKRKLQICYAVKRDSLPKN